MMNAKYKVGQTVTIKTRKTGILTGTIEEVQRIFKRVNPDGSFDRHGLSTFETEIKSIALPHTFDGETLTVEYPEQKCAGFTIHAKTMVSKHYSWAYSIRTTEGEMARALGGSYRVLTDEAAIIDPAKLARKAKIRRARKTQSAIYGNVTSFI